MTRFSRFILGFSFFHAGFAAWFHYRENVFLQLVIALFFLSWFCLLLGSWARLGWRNPRAIAISAAAIVWLAAAPFVGARVGIMVRDAVFRLRLPEYEAAVRLVQAGTPQADIRLAYRINSDLAPTGGSEVIFYWGSGFPVKHTAFVYRTDDPSTHPRFVREWSRIGSLAPNWYVVKD